MPSESNRREPRLPTATEVDVIVGGRRVHGVVRTASERGVGVELDASDRGLMRGASVKIDLELEGTHMEIPGRVAWHRKSETGLGVQLALEIAGSAYRGAYQRWIARLAGVA